MVDPSAESFGNFHFLNDWKLPDKAGVRIAAEKAATPHPIRSPCDTVGLFLCLSMYRGGGFPTQSDRRRRTLRFHPRYSAWRMAFLCWVQGLPLHLTRLSGNPSKCWWTLDNGLLPRGIENVKRYAKHSLEEKNPLKYQRWKFGKVGGNPPNAGLGGKKSRYSGKFKK